MRDCQSAAAVDAYGQSQAIPSQSYYRRFIRGFSVIAAPLYKLMRNNAQFHWGVEQQDTFDELKTALTSAPVLGTVRVVLSQDQHGEERVLAYASRTLSAPERVYSVTRKELLAVVYGLKHFRQYLIGHKFVIRSDHASLQWIRRPPEPIAQAGRWFAIMKEYDFTV